MKFISIFPEEYYGIYNIINCDKCKKNIKYKEGFFHCYSCGEDYHKICLGNNKEDEEAESADEEFKVP